MLGKERLCKVDKVGDYLITFVRPERSKFKTVACPLGFGILCPLCVVYMVVARGVAVILGVCAVGYNEYLNVLKKLCTPRRFNSI